MNIIDRIWPVHKGDEVRFHFPNESIRTLTLQGYMIGCEDMWKPVVYAKLTDTFGGAYAVRYKDLIQSVRQ